MSKWIRRLMIGLVLLAVLLGTTATGLFRMSQWQPEFYARSLDASPATLAEAGDELEKKVLDIHNEVVQRSQWQATISQDQINGWLASDLPEKFPHVLPSMIKQPRVQLLDEALKIACLYEGRQFSAVISVELRPYLTDEPNVLAVRIRDVRFGAIPGLKKKITQQISIGAIRAGIPLRWVQDEEDPIALIDLNSALNDQEASLQLESFELQEGQAVLSGQSGAGFQPAF